MKQTCCALLLGALALTAPAIAQDATDKPLPAVPPATARSTAGTTNEQPQSNPGYAPSASKEGYAHDTGNVANGPTPPNTSGRAPTAGAQPHAAQKARANIGNQTGYQHGNANIGNSSEPHGILGENGGRASATMQSGQIDRH